MPLAPCRIAAALATVVVFGLSSATAHGLASQRPAGASATRPAPAPLAGLDVYIERTMRDWGVPGVAIAVVKDDSVVWAQGFGRRTVGRDDPVTQRTMFAIGSSTKAFTAAALASLVDDGKLTWDTRVESVLPGFALSDTIATQLVTVRDLLSHRTGLPGENLLFWGSPFGRDEVIRRVRYLPLRASPRTRFEYQNIMFLAAGQIVPAVSGRSWDDLVRERLFAPLGMVRSVTKVAELSRFDDVASPHAFVDGAMRPVPYLDLDNAAPAGSIVSTVLDLAQWVRLHIRDGMYRGRRIISDSAMREMHSPQMIIPSSYELAAAFPDARLLDYGLGWFLHEYHDNFVIEHGGQTDAMHGEVAMMPDRGLGVIVLTNSGRFGYPTAIAYRVFDAYLGRPPRDWSAELRRNLAAMNGGGARRSAAAAQVPDPTLSVPVDRFVGRYEHPMYGDASVSLVGDTLVLSLLGRRASMRPWQRDTFRIAWPSSESLLRGVVPTASFAVDAQRVRSVRLGRAGEFARVDTIPESSEVRVDEDVHVPMRDGVRLSADIYRAAGAPERLPVIVMRTPYDKRSYRRDGSVARAFAEAGYIVVAQDVRGKFASDGEYAVQRTDADDGYDTIEWAAAQRWSTGKVGTFGCSYLGEVQMLTASRRPPHLAAMVPQSAGGAVGAAGNRYGYFGAFEGGAFALSASFGWFPRAGNKVKDAPEMPPVDFATALRTLPVVEMVRRHGGPSTEFEPYLTHALTDPWWSAAGYISDSSRFDTPALHVNSWYDYGANETLTLFELMRRNSVSPLARDNQFVVMGPGPHCSVESGREQTKVGDLDVGDARFPSRKLYVDWFDHWLKGVDNGVERMPRVQYYAIGRDAWRSSPTWPPPGAAAVSLYLRGNGRANTREGDGLLSRDAPTAHEPSDRFTYDPGNPVPSRGGSVCCTGNPKDAPGAFDQSDIEMRPDVLVYTTTPLHEPMEVAGPLRAELYVSSSAKDTDFVVKLVDVFPDGRAFNVQDGIQRARYRDGYSTPVFMQPGETYRVVVDLHSTAYLFRLGHRIRLEVSSSNFPRFDRNLNTGGTNYDETAWVLAENAVHHGPARASRLQLTVLPAQAR